MENFEKYITNNGKIQSNNCKSIMKIIEGSTTLLQKCLFLRILMISETTEVEELESFGLRDVIHEWFEAAAASEDVYFLHLLLDSFDRLPHSLIRDFNEQTRKLCNLNNAELTVKAKNLVMKWRKEDKLIVEKRKFTYITLDKSTTVKRIASQYRSLGDEDEDIVNNSTTAIPSCEEETKVVGEKPHNAIVEEVSKAAINETIILPMITELPDNIVQDENIENIAKVSNNIKKIKRVSWASNENLKTIIPIEYGFEKESPDQSTSPVINGTQDVPTLCSSPNFENNKTIYSDTNFIKKAHLNATEERKLALSHTLFEIVSVGKNELDLGSLTCSEAYNALKSEETNLKHKGIFLFPPK